LGVVEVVIQADIDEKSKRLCDLSPKDCIKYIYVNGQLIFPIRLHAKLNATTFSIKRNMDLEIHFDKELGSSEVAVPMTKLKKKFLTQEFFDYFSNRVVIIVSPHSDDSAISCGGLIYYLRNCKLWQVHGKCPPVNILIMTKSPTGVGPDYFKEYSTYIGFKEETIDSLGAEAYAKIRFNESLAEKMLLDTNSHWLKLPKKMLEDKKSESVKTFGAFLDQTILAPIKKDYTPLFLIPQFGDQHRTHQIVTEFMLKVIREWPSKKLSGAELWMYESPWGALDTSDINRVIPLDKHAMFAKCQAISMHQSQEVRTQFTDVALARSRYYAETLPESLIGGYGSGGLEWDYVEVFSSRDWSRKIFFPT